MLRRLNIRAPPVDTRVMRILLAAWLISAGPALTPPQLVHRLMADPPSPYELPAGLNAMSVYRDDNFPGTVRRHFVGAVSVGLMGTAQPPRIAREEVRYCVYLTTEDALVAFNRRDRDKSRELGTITGLPHSDVMGGLPNAGMVFLDEYAAVGNVLIESSVLGGANNAAASRVATQFLLNAVAAVRKLQR